MKSKIWRKWKDESGVAMLLALGILALLIVLTMSFAAAALNAKRMSVLTDALTKSRQYSEAGLQQLISMLKTDLSDNTNIKNLYPATCIFVHGTGAWANKDFMISAKDSGSSTSNFMDDDLVDALSYYVDGKAMLPTSLPSLGAGTTMKPSWIPFFETRQIKGASVQVMSGRFSFLLIDESGKVDPNVAINTGALSSFAEGDEPDSGMYVGELDMTDMGISSAFAAALKSSYPGEWYSRYHIIRALNPTQTDVDKLNRYLFPFRQSDTLDAMDTVFDLQDVDGMAAQTLVNKIPWFRNWVEFGNFSDSTTRARNIAANVIDYCDTDHNSTTDDPASPTFWGDEKVPYFSRLIFEVNNTSHATNGTKSQPELTIFCIPELINMFGDLSSYATSCYVDVVLDVTWKAEDGSQKNEDLTYTFNPFNTADVVVSGDFTSSGYITFDSGVAATSQIDIINQAGKYEADEIVLKVQRMRLMNTNSGTNIEYWDYGSTNASNKLTALSVGTKHYFTFTALNPVANLLPDEWTSSMAGIEDFSSPTKEWWNTNPLYIRNDMMRHVVELGNILRMEPFGGTNPEDGSRTINLIDYKYNGDPQTPGLYAEDTDSIIDDTLGTLDDGEGNGGDRNLLDMVRLGNNDVSERVVPGRININTQDPDVLKALFYRISSLTYTEDTAGDRPIDTADIDTLVAAIIAKTSVSPIPVGIYSNYRNPPVYGLLFQDSMSTLSQEAREHLLVLTKQLISAEHNYFTAIVTSQVIQDAGGVNEDIPLRVYNPTTGNVDTISSRYGRYDLGADKILSESKILAVLYRNAFTNRVTIERFHYLED